MADNVTTPPATDYSGVREYIGARYVPVFADPAEWDNTRGYEPLTIVLHQGNSFTSTQYVPTGVDINDTKYWLETGNWNAQIEAYREEVKRYDGRITQNADGIEANTQAIADEAAARASADTALQQLIEGEETARKAADTELRSDLSAAIAAVNQQNILSLYKGKNCVWVGDSFTTGVGADPRTKRVSTVFCNAMGMTEFNYGVGATGWIWGTTANTPYITQVQNAYDAMTQNQRENTAMVVLPGTSTDVSHGSTSKQIGAAATLCAKKASDLFPNAVIYVIPMIWDKALFTYDAYDATVEICDQINKAAIPRVKMDEDSYTWLLGRYDFYTSDNVHPNNTGYAVWAAKMVSSILGSANTAGYINSFTSDFGKWDKKTYYLKNGFVFMPGYKITNVSDAGGDKNIGTLPNNIRPAYNQTTVLSSGGEAVGYVTYQTDGVILMTHSARDTTTRTYFNIGPCFWPIYGVR
jgi:lysophospholipase L1-like esterase